MKTIQRQRARAEHHSLEALITRFNIEQSAIEVNFRHLMQVETGITRYAHAIHPYPAKLLVNIPQYFIAELSLNTESTLLDPFCGSGTVLYEGALAGLRPVGADANPLARLITQAKLTRIDGDSARQQLAEIMDVHPRAGTHNQ